MTIEYSLEEMYSFPGPNLLFSGDKEMFYDFSNLLLQLLQEKDNEINLTKLKSIRFIGDIKNVVLKNTQSKYPIVNLIDKTVHFHLNLELIEKLFIWSVILSRDETTFYLEFLKDDFENLEFEINVIWSSELVITI